MTNSPRASSSSISSIGVESSPNGALGDRGKVTRARIKNMVKELVTGEQHIGGDSFNDKFDGSTNLSECVQVCIKQTKPPEMI